jgi:hypothetical protein
VGPERQASMTAEHHVNVWRLVYLIAAKLQEKKK